MKSLSAILQRFASNEAIAHASRLTIGLVAVMLLSATPSLASTTPSFATTFTDQMTQIVDWLAGPMGRILGMLAFIIGGATWALSRNKAGAKRAGQAIVGCAIIVAAGNIADWFGFTSALM